MQYPGYLIKRGSANSEAVKFVQAVVGVTADGAFGPNTEAAVKSWQSVNGLTADGFVGSQTWAVMVASSATPAKAPTPKPPATDVGVTGDKGTDIMNMVTVGRTEWDVSEPERSAKRSWDQVTGIEVHYTGAPGPKSLTFADKQQWLLSIERYHEQTKGWSDIFYNMFVFADGEVWLGRNPLVQSQSSLFNWMTVHTPGTVGMELTKIQKVKIAKMADIVGGSLRGHGERASTGCPGESALSFIQSYRDGSFHQTLSGMRRGEFAVAMLGSVQAMIDAGITSQSLATYNAEAMITREQAATMFVRYAGESASSLWDGLETAVDLGFYSSVGNGGDVFQKSWFNGVFAKVESHMADIAAVEAARIAAEQEAKRVAAEAKAAKAAAEAARIEDERVAAEAAAAAAEELERLEAEQAAAAEELARLEAEQAAAEEDARAAAEEEARLADEAAAAAAAKHEADIEAAAEAERLAAEEAARLAAAEEAARVIADQESAQPETLTGIEIPEDADVACCEPTDDEEVGGLLRKILEWIFSIFKK